MTTALLVILAIFLLGSIIQQFLVRSILAPVFRLFVVPGVIVHELGHAAACVVTGSKIRQIRFFKREGGEVAHEPSKIPIVGPLLITFAPIVVGFFVIIVLGERLIPHLNLSGIELGFNDFMPFLSLVVRSIHWTALSTWIILYFILSVGAAMTPSAQDLKNSALPLVIAVALLVIIFRTPSLHHTADGLAISIVPALMLALFIMLMLGILSFIIYATSIIFGISKTRY